MSDFPPNVSMAPTFDNPALKPPTNPDVPLVEKVTNTILENQERRSDDTNTAHLEHLLGPDHKSKVRKAISLASNSTSLWETVSTQPMTQPIGLLFYMKSDYAANSVSETSYSVPTVNLRIESDATAARVRRTGCLIKKGFSQHQINKAFIMALDSLRLEVFNDLMISGTDPNSFVPTIISSDLDPVELVRHATTIFKKTMRGMANTILCHPKHGAVLKPFKRRFNIITDYQFPEDKLTMWYSGASLLDQPYIVAPYYFNLSKYDDDTAGIGIRYGKKLVHPGHILTLKIKD